MVSIIIPAYNSEKYIDKCMESLIHQTYSDIEIIVIDDGSKDNTWSLLQEWATRDGRIIALHYDNAGVVTTRQRGLKQAKGELLMYVDADDYLPADAVKTLVNAIKDTDIAIGGYTLEWAESGSQTPVLHPKNFSTPNQCATYCLRHGETFLPIKLYRTAIFREAVKIPDDICVQEDTIGTLQYLNSCKSVSYTDKSIYYYLKHKDSASYNLSARHLYSLLKVASILGDMYSSCGDKELLKEIKNTCLKNLHTYIKLTKSPDLDKLTIDKVLNFIGSDSSLKSKCNFKILTIKTSLKNKKIGNIMYHTSDAYNDIKKKTKQCLRKLIK